MSRVPTVVLLSLGITCERAKEIGMVGCSLQLDDQGETLWREMSILVDSSKEAFRLFATVQEIPVQDTVKGGIIRVDALVMREYISMYLSISRFLENWRKERFLRLGSRARLPPWELNSREAYLIGMAKHSFDERFISDPRGSPTYALISNQTYFLHNPVVKDSFSGMPLPESRGWIRLCSCAKAL